MKNQKKYVWGLDLSISNSGVAIFYEGTPVFIGSIPTNAKDTHGVRLKCIYEYFSDLKTKYPPEVVCVERAFSRFNTATAVIYRVVGVVNMLFYDVEQIYYPPKTIKECLVKGNATKKDVETRIKEMYPDVNFENNDESDAFAVVLTYIKKREG